MKKLIVFLFLCFAMAPFAANAMSFTASSTGPKDNLVASVPPLSTNDITQGYSVGSKWLDNSSETIWRAVDVTTNAAIWLQDRPHPGYIAGRFWSTYDGPTVATTAVGTLDTVIYLYPFSVDKKITVVSLNYRTVTGAASCAVKIAIWANDATTTHRPTGVPIAGSNTGQSCASNNTTQAITVNIVLYPGKIYWAAAAFTTAAPQMLSLNNAGGIMDRLIGQSSMASNTATGLTAPYTYASDITTLDLTAATFSNAQAAVGIPRMMLGN